MACAWGFQILLASYLSLLLGATMSLAVEDKVWSQCNQSSEQEDCQCGVSLHNAIMCTDHSLQIQPCYCMYYDPAENKTIAGKCMFTCFSHGPMYYKTMTRRPLQNASQFNIDMCGSEMTLKGGINREGRFCGRCKENYGLAAYSYQYVTCIPCENYSYKNWLRYFAAALLPLTVFYLVVVIFKIDFTSSRLGGRVFAVQCILSPMQMRIIDSELREMVISQIREGFYILFSFVGILNLDFARAAYHSLCLHPAINAIHVLALDFVVALYPFFLIFLTYIAISMYDKNYRLFVWAWKPFKYILGRWWRGSDVKGSLIQTFASFILLSSVKILSVSYDLLVPVQTYDATGAVSRTKYFYYDATIEYFGPKHWPYGIVALCIGFVFVILPLLLLVLYPCKCFQRALNCLGWRCQALRVFMDVFQGSFKTEPHDLRYFSAFYLILRVLLLLFVAHTGTIFYIVLIVFLLLVSTIIFAFFEPYKDHWSNKVDTVILLSMSLLYAAYASSYIAVYLDNYFATIATTVFVLSVAFWTFLLAIPVFWFLVKFFKLPKAFGSIWKLYKEKVTSEKVGLLESFTRD